MQTNKDVDRLHEFYDASVALGRAISLFIDNDANKRNLVHAVILTRSQMPTAMFFPDKSMRKTHGRGSRL